MHEYLGLARDWAVRWRDKIGVTSLYIVGLLGVLLVGLYVRTRNLKLLQGNYLLGLDPYCFYRYAGYIIDNGRLMAHDALRYVPIGYVPEATDKFFSYCLAYGYLLLKWTGVSRMNFHILYPAVAGIIGLVFLFLFVRELFGNKVALIATAFAAVIPAYIYRTGAGFADHEALALMWMFAAFWLFAKAWKSEKLWRGLSFSVGSGLFAGALILTWGGYRFLLAAVGIFVILGLMLSKIKTKQFYVLWSWAAVAMFFVYLRFNSVQFVKSPDVLLLLFSVVASVFCFSLSKINLSDIIEKRVPLGFASLMVAALVGSISVILTGIINMGDLYARLLHPTGANRLAVTVSENAQPFFFGGNGWYSSFGLTVFLMLAGAILLFYRMFSGDKRYSGWLTAGWVVTLFAFVMGRYRAGSFINRLFSSSYLYVAAIFACLVIGVYLHTYYKDQKAFGKLFNVKWELLLLFSWFIFSLVIARGAVRTIMALAPVAAVVVGYFVVHAGKYLLKTERTELTVIISSAGVAFLATKLIVIFVKLSSRTQFIMFASFFFLTACVFYAIYSNIGRKGAAICTFIVFVAFVLFCAGANTYGAYQINKGSGSGYPGQWENSMNWLKESTSEDAVIAHWWDYGYWVQTMAGRSTIGDGGNAMAWDHQLGRYGLLGRNASEYLSYYKTHNVTHLLISEEEIGKFHAFATVGSNDTFDLRSTVGIFILQPEVEVRNGSRLVYKGGWSLDKDYVIGSKVLGEGSSYVVAFSLDKAGDAISNPQAIFYDGTNQYAAPLKCVCQSGSCKVFNEDGFGGCLVLAPKYVSNTEVNPIGAGFFVSEKVEDTVLVKLYLKGEEIEYFKEVYNDGTPLGLYGGNIIGPIKIWEVQYPEGIEADEKYLEHSPHG